MKKFFSVISLICLITCNFAFGSEIKLDGIFQGQNLFVMNPFASSGVGFCVYEVRVNNEMATDEINSSAFEIDLKVFNLKLGDKVAIIIKHKENCTPKVLNPDVLKPKSTFEVTSLDINKDGTVNWKTKNEAGSLDFVVEQYRWNKWVKVKSVKGKGTPSENSYSVKVPLHSGENKVRIKQTDWTKKPRYSEEKKFRSMIPPVTVSPKNKVENEITFSMETMYEIYDNYGNIVKKGIGDKIDVSGLKEGVYFLNFDNQMIDFKKK